MILRRRRDHSFMPTSVAAVYAGDIALSSDTEFEYTRYKEWSISMSTSVKLILDAMFVFFSYSCFSLRLSKL